MFDLTVGWISSSIGVTDVGGGAHRNIPTVHRTNPLNSAKSGRAIDLKK